MKICYLTHDMRHNTGCGVFARGFIEQVQKLRPGWRIDVVVEEKGGYALERAVLRMGNKGLLKNFFPIRRLVKNCDVIHALDGMPYGLAAVVCSLGLRKKVIITAVGSGAIAPLSARFFSPLVKFVYRRADIFVAISHYTARKIHTKIPRLPIQVINLGVEPSLFESKSGDELLARQLEGKKPYIFSDGSLKPRKGYEISVPAFAIVAKKFSNLNYVIMHNKVERGFEQRGKLKNLVGELGLDKRVFFIEDPSDDFRRVLYRNAELFVLMSQEIGGDVEGFGLAFLQAAACGLPVVGSRGSAVEDAMLHGRNGFLVEPKDVKAIASAITKILDNNQLKNKFAEESQRFVEQMSWRRVAEQYLLLYEEVSF